MNFVFVVLHYCAPEMTAECIDSIRKRIIYGSYRIVIVDNASPDDSGIALQERYSGCADVHVLLNETNEGFARGNNAGYRYAVENLHPDFLIAINNDVLMLQPDFLARIESIYYERNFHVLGPDILNPDGERRNPHRIRNFTKKDLHRMEPDDDPALSPNEAASPFGKPNPFCRGLGFSKGRKRKERDRAGSSAGRRGSPRELPDLLP